MATKTANEIGQIWKQAEEEFHYRLGKKKHARVKNIDTSDTLIQEVESSLSRYSAKESVRRLNHLRPLLDWLWELNRSVQSFVQASPKPFVLFWGSLQFALEFGSRYFRYLDDLTECFRSISIFIPRLKAYGSALAADLPYSLKKSLLEYYIEFIRFCLDAVQFYESSPWRNFFRRSFKVSQTIRVDKLNFLAREVDYAAQFTSINSIRQSQHRLLESFSESQSGSRKMLLGDIPFSNLPLPKEDFFSRETELKSIYSALFRYEDRTKTSCVCIHGLPGAGKSQLALQFADQNRFQFEVILWISAETQAKLGESFREAAKGLCLIDQEHQPHIEQEKQLIRWFEKTSKGGSNGPVVKWLAIFDNVTDASILKPYLPCTSGGSVIITCRDPEISRLFSNSPRCRISLGSFTTATATEFLLTQVDRAENASDEDVKCATAIAKVVGNHPLPLDMIACYIRQCGMRLGRFLQTYPKFERDFLFEPELSYGPENFNQQSVSDVFALNSQFLDPYAKRLIQMLAFLDPDGVPIKLFVGKTQQDMICEGPDEPDKFPNFQEALQTSFNSIEGALYPALKILLKLALITMDEEGNKIRCHRLLQIAVEKAMSTDEVSLVINQLVFYLNASYPFQPDGKPLLSQWLTCDEFSSNVMALVKSYQRHESQIPAPVLLSEVACRCSWYHYEKGQNSIAQAIADEQIAICQTALEDKNHPGYSPWFVRDMISHHINTKGAVAKKIPLPDHGLHLTGEVLAIRKSNCRDSNEEDKKWIAAARGNHALSLLAIGRVSEALCILKELAARTDMQPNMDIYFSNICQCLCDLGLYEEALDYANKAMTIITRAWGAGSAQGATILHHFSRVYEGLGNETMALESLNKCVIIREAIMSDHPDTGFALHRMGVLLHKIGNPQKAIAYLRRAYQILSECECHPGAICRTALAISNTLHEIKYFREHQVYADIAEKCRRQIHDVDASSLGDNWADYDRFVYVCSR